MFLCELCVSLIQILILITMEIKERKLQKFRVTLYFTTSVDIDVYAEDEDNAQQLVEDKITATEYSNDTIGFEISEDYLDSEGNVEEMQIACVSVDSYPSNVEMYGSPDESDDITLYAKEETDWNDTDYVFTSVESLKDWYEEDSDEEDNDESDS